MSALEGHRDEETSPYEIDQKQTLAECQTPEQIESGCDSSKGQRLPVAKLRRTIPPHESRFDYPSVHEVWPKCFLNVI